MAVITAPPGPEIPEGPPVYHLRHPEPCYECMRREERLAYLEDEVDRLRLDLRDARAGKDGGPPKE